MNRPFDRYLVRLFCAGVFALVGILLANPAQSTTFPLNDTIDLGSIDRIGDVNWDDTLSTSWDKNFSVGGIVGKKNATVIPEVKVAGAVIVPEVKADTRTGARFSGNVSGGTGLDFFANFQASGLAPESNFHFDPRVELPADATAGEFFALQTSPGMVSNSPFDADQVDLPSFDAGMDFHFDLDLNSKIEGGLFPIIPYGSANFNPPGIHVNQGLLNFQFDLDPDTGTPPTFSIFEGTPFATSVGIDNSQNVVDQQLSVDIKDKKAGANRRLDIGSVQLVNPFGVGESVLGPNEPNLTRSASVDDSTVRYSFESPLLRLGLDLDGIAAFLGTGESFTRLEEEIKRNNAKIADITADLIDIKYGPEIGYRESVEVKPDFDVTLQFDHDVAVETDVDIDLVHAGSGLSARWNDLPEISLLSDQDVEATVEFNNLTGEQTKRGSFYLSDYLELTLLELENVNVLDTINLSLPPLLHTHTSLLGKLLGEVDLDVFNDSQEIDAIPLGEQNLGSQTITLHALPSSRLYRVADQNFDDPSSLANWQSLADHAQPGSLSGKVLVMGLGDESTMHVGQLAPMVFNDEVASQSISLAELFEQQTGVDADVIVSPVPDGEVVYTDPGTAIEIQGLEVPEGSEYRYESGGIRRWKLASIHNDGLIQATRSTEIMANDQLLQIAGSGETVFQGPTALRGGTIFVGEGHQLALLEAQGLNITAESVPVLYLSGKFPPSFHSVSVDVPSVAVDNQPFKVSDNIENAGTIRLGATNADIVLSSRFGNASTGTLLVDSGSGVTLNTPDIVQDGQFAVSDVGSILQIAGNPEITTGGNAAMFEAGGGGLLRFSGSPKIGERTTLDLDNTLPEKSMAFRAVNGGEVRFEHAVDQRFDVRTRFEIEPGGTMRFNGITFPEVELTGNTDNHLLYTDEASHFMEVDNRGTLIIESGRNNLFLNPADSSSPDVPPTPPEPFVVPINLVNDGKLRIEAGAEFGFQVEIKDYAEGGTKLVGGTWELIGADELGTNLVAPPDPGDPLDPDLAVLNVDVVKVSNGDNILGVSFNIEDFDTELAINAANVTLSGKASFPYFNSVRENDGVIHLDNYYFQTEGDHLNRGEIQLTDGVLLVQGNLTVDEGSVTADSNSVALGTAMTSVIGGSYDWQDPSGTAYDSLATNSQWIVREKWMGVDDEGSDIVLPSVVSFGDTTIPTIGPSGGFLLDGAQAVMEPLAGLETIDGQLTLTGGNELRLAQSLTNHGTLQLSDAGKLYVDGDMLTTGQLNVGTDSYLDISGAFTTMGGSIHLDGVVHATELVVDNATTFGGAGRFVGNVDNHGILNPGNSPGVLQVLGDYNQSADGALAVQIGGTTAGTEFDVLDVTGIASLAGMLDVSLIDLGGGQFMPVAGDTFEILSTGTLTGTFAGGVSLPELTGHLMWNVDYDTDADRVLLKVSTPFTADFDGDGDVDETDLSMWQTSYGMDANADTDGDNDSDGVDFLTWQQQYTGDLSGRFAASTKVPEPSSVVIVMVSVVFVFSFRAKRLKILYVGF